MDLEKRIQAFGRLGAIFRENRNEQLHTAIVKANQHNGWFTTENIHMAIFSLGEMLREESLKQWLLKYPSLSPKSQGAAKNVAVIMAGNIPLVGFHDFLCVLMSGSSFLGKLSSDDQFLLPAVADLLIGLETGFKGKIKFSDSLRTSKSDIAAVIATGSNNSARYFEYYFKKYPHVIRRNRNAVAVLDGKETLTDLQNLGKDIFQYFGMGCRSVSKIYVPHDYNLDKFFEAIVDFGEVINHNKYCNNYQYHRSIYLLNSDKFLDNNFLMLKESGQIASPVATLHYERYSNKDDLLRKLEEHKEPIQCVVAGSGILQLRCIPFGQAQSPELWDYADGVDTMEFLLNL